MGMVMQIPTFWSYLFSSCFSYVDVDRRGLFIQQVFKTLVSLVF